MKQETFERSVRSALRWFGSEEAKAYTAEALRTGAYGKEPTPTPEEIVRLVAGDNKEFALYCAKMRARAHELLFMRALGDDWERKYQNAMQRRAGTRLVPGLLKARVKAETQLPKFFSKMRTLLTQHVNAVLDSDCHSDDLLTFHPELDRSLRQFLKANYPIPRGTRSVLQLEYPPINRLSAPAARMEAIRLLLVLLTWKKLDHLRRCRECECDRIFVANRNDQQFCGTPCRQRFASHDTKFKEKRRKYMKDRRSREKASKPSGQKRRVAKK